MIRVMLWDCGFVQPADDPDAHTCDAHRDVCHGDLVELYTTDEIDRERNVAQWFREMLETLHVALGAYAEGRLDYSELERIHARVIRMWDAGATR